MGQESGTWGFDGAHRTIPVSRPVPEIITLEADTYRITGERESERFLDESLPTAAETLVA
jgi:hypothetical protein